MAQGVSNIFILNDRYSESTIDIRSQLLIYIVSMAPDTNEHKVMIAVTLKNDVILCCFSRTRTQTHTHTRTHTHTHTHTHVHAHARARAYAHSWSNFISSHRLMTIFFGLYLFSHRRFGGGQASTSRIAIYAAASCTVLRCNTSNGQNVCRC